MDKQEAFKLGYRAGSQRLKKDGELTTLLNQQLADGFDLFSRTKQAHWNVKGKNFYQLHLLFDTLAEELLEQLDVIGERITALGEFAIGTVGAASSNSSLPPFGNPYLEDDLINALIDDYSIYAEDTRNATDIALAANDQDTADIFIDVSRMLEQHLYFLKAHQV